MPASQPQPAPITVRQRIVQVCLFLVAAIAVFGGTLQMFLGQPDTTSRPGSAEACFGVAKALGSLPI